MSKDNVEHPKHYSWLKDLCNVEPIDICRQLPFNRGNAIKYILRCGVKVDANMSVADKAIEDLEKAIFYLKDEIKRIKQLNNKK